MKSQMAAAGSSSAKAARLSGFAVLASVLAFGALFGLIGAIIGVPTAAGLPIVAEE
jgi:predicted PurR-regulated permease PerM